MGRSRGEFFWVDEYELSEVASLPMEARGLHRTMLTRAWVQGGKLPADEATLMRMVRATPAEWKRSWPLVQPHWATSTDGTIFNVQQAKTIAQGQKLYDSRSEAGAAGGRASAEQRRSKFEANRQQTDSKPEANDVAQDQDQECSVLPSVERSLPPADAGSAPAKFIRTANPASEAIAELWGRVCPTLPQPDRPLARGIRNAIQSALSRERNRDWEATFRRVSRSSFLTGQRAEFRAALTWVIGPKNLAKIDAGQYDDPEERPRQQWLRSPDPDPPPEAERLSPHEVAANLAQLKRAIGRVAGNTA